MPDDTDQDPTECPACEEAVMPVDDDRHCPLCGDPLRPTNP